MIQAVISFLSKCYNFMKFVGIEILYNIVLTISFFILFLNYITSFCVSSLNASAMHALLLYPFLFRIVIEQ